MSSSTSRILVMVVRLAWVVALVIGVLLLTGRDLGLAAHILPGSLVALSLLTLGLAARATTPVPALIAIVVALLLPAAGLMQLTASDAAAHAFQGIHFLLALASIAFAEILGKKLRSQA